MAYRRRGFLWAISLAAIAAILFGLWRSQPRPKLHVLLVTLDTTRADHVGCYGYEGAKTPVLDALAAKGVLFERAYTPAPLTLPSHTSMMTGLLPPEHGLITNGRGRLSEEVPTLAGILTDAGYDTGAFVGSFVLHRKFGLARGFATYDDDMTNTEPTEHGLHRQRDGKRVIDSALEWLGQSRSKPTFCWVHLYDPHHPYLSHTDEFGEEFVSRPYDGELAYVDRLLQRLFEFVEKQRAAGEETLIVVVGDHGEGLGDHDEIEHGSTLYENVLRVPWIWAGPGVTASAKRVPQPVSIVDLRPTLLAALNLRDPGPVTGRSLLPALQGNEIKAEDCYAATDDPLLEHGWHPLRSLTTERWKYIRTPDVELYDLAADPHEKNNLASRHKEQVETLEKQLAELERGLTTRQEASVDLTPQERKALTSLGYFGSQSAPRTVDPGQPLPDVKRMLALDNAVSAAHHQQLHGDAPGAEQRLRKLGADAPDYLPARLYLIEALSVQQKFDEARELADAILKHDPDNGDAHFQLGIIAARQGKLDEAIDQFNKSLAAKSNAVGVLFNLGMALAAAGRGDEAERSFRDVLEEDPAYVKASVQLGMLFAARNEMAEAEEQYRLALKYSPQLMEGHANLAILLARQKRMDEAGEHFARAAALAPDNAETRFNYGTYLLGQGHVDESIRELEATLRINPNHARAAARLEQARRARGG